MKKQMDWKSLAIIAGGILTVLLALIALGHVLGLISCIPLAVLVMMGAH